MHQFSGIFLTISAFFLCLTAIGCNFFFSSAYLIVKIILCPLIAVHLAIAIEFAILIFLPVSRLHTFSSAVCEIAVNPLIRIVAEMRFRKFVKSSKQVRATQHDLLMDILTKNANTEFGRKMGFENIKTLEQYQKAVPLSTYEDYRPYIERIEKKGESNLLTSDTIMKLTVSSGTTGKCKLLPFVNEMWKLWYLEFSPPFLCRMMSHHTFLCNLAPLKTFEISYVPNWRFTETGIPIGPVSAQYGKQPYLMSVLWTTPNEAKAFMSEPAQSYIHWLFALIDDNIKSMTCTFAGTLLVNFEFFQKNWKQLASDIRNGRISTNSHDIPPEIVDAIQRNPVFAKGNPRRADEIEAACSKGFEGIIKRLWPRLDVICVICTGAHSIYRDRIKWYVGKGAKLLSPFLGASEGMFGVPVNDEQEGAFVYTLLIRMTFFEFIPENEMTVENPTVLLADQLEIGKRYEIVITSHNGFYRYRMGDIVCVASFYNQTPVVEFCSRVGGILDLRGEKTTEDMVVAALETAIGQWKNCRGLIEFTATDSLIMEKSTRNDVEFSGKLYYAIFVELNGVCRPLSDTEIAAFDEALCAISYPYKSYRIKEAISKPKIFVVRHGTFEEIKSRILERNKTISNQFKAPRYQKNQEFVRFLVDSSFRDDNAD